MSQGLPTRAENYSERYNQLVEAADLAEKSDVRGCMVIKPYGFALWEKIQAVLDKMFKNTGHVNAYFPLLIPKSYLSKEADHVEGFAKECAVVTHHRLRAAKEGGLEVDPDAKLEEELVIRPTSETIIRRTYKNRITSHRDLPLLINQRANVVRREMRTRIFLRTAEFLRQEGHTAHATQEEAIAEAQQMLDVYQDLLQNFLAIYATPGAKTESERFAGAVDTLTLEAMMQDGKALQTCTSHFLGQNFAKAFEVTFVNKANQAEHVRATSWGMSTRILGALIMAHSDDKGLILPPALAPYHVVFVPIAKSPEELVLIENYIGTVIEQLEDTQLKITGKYVQWSDHLRYHIDTDDQKSPGWKFAQRELKGVPVRIAIGMRDIEAGTVELARRDTGEKQSVKHSELVATIHATLVQMQADLYEKHKAFSSDRTFEVANRDQFKEKIEQGFVLAHRDGTAETETKIKEETSATIRCIPLDQPDQPGACVYSGKSSTKMVLFAKAY